jgi:hypothetical protein
MLTKVMVILLVFVVDAERRSFVTTQLFETVAECQAMAKALHEHREALGYPMIAARCIAAPPYKSNERES